MRAGVVAEQPAPDAKRVPLGGRCVLPGFADAHVHFPTWSMGLRQARLEGARSRDEALERVEAALAAVPAGGWLRGLGWREGDWPEPPDLAALDRVTGAVPAALMSKDYHSLWVNSAALARADGPLELPGGVVERDADGRPAGILRENAAWAFRDRYVRPTQAEMVEGSREGMRIAAARGRDRAARQGRLARVVRGAPAPARRRRAARARLAVAAVGAPRRARGARDPLGLRQRHAAARLPQGLHGRHARLGDGAAPRRLGRRDHEPSGARGRGTARRPGGLAGRGPRDRRRGQPLRPRRLRGHARRVAAARPAAAHRARPAARARGVRALRRDRRHRLRPVQPRPVGPRPRRPPLGGQAGRVCIPLARRRGRAARERVGRARRGARPARRHRRRRAPHARRAPAVEARAGADARRGAARDLHRPGLARAPGAPPWDAAAGNARRPRRPRPRPL